MQVPEPEVIEFESEVRVRLEISTESPTLREFGPPSPSDDRRILFLEILGPPWAWGPENTGKRTVWKGLWEGLSRLGLDPSALPGTKCTITHLGHSTHSSPTHPTIGLGLTHSTPTVTDTVHSSTPHTVPHHTAFHH